MKPVRWGELWLDPSTGQRLGVRDRLLGHVENAERRWRQVTDLCLPRSEHMLRRLPQAIAGLFIALGVGAGTAAVISTIVISTAVSLGLGMISKLLMNKPGAQGMGSQGRNVNVKQSAAPRRLLYGFNGKMGGVLTYLAIRGANNAYLDLVFTHSGHRISAYNTMYFDGVAVPLDGSGNATGNFAGLVHVEKKLGHPGEAAFPGLVANSGGAWTSNHRQEGCASAYVALKFDANKFPNGVPVITFDLDGKDDIYDPRTATSGYTKNAALCVRDYLTLPTAWGFPGLVPADEIDDTSVIAAANTCDELVALNTSPVAYEYRYECNGSLDFGRGWDTDLPDLLSAMAGNLVPAGKYRIYAGAWRAPALPAITDNDLRGPIQFQSMRSRRTLCNTVKGQYVSPANNWQPSDFPVVSNATYIAQDGGEVLLDDIKLPFTTSATCAQRLAKIHLERNRRQGTGNLPCKMVGWEYTPMDILQCTHPRFSWSGKPFEVQQTTLALDGVDAPTLGVDLVIQEADANIYAWSSSEEGSLASPATLPQPNNAVVAAPTGILLASGVSEAVLRSDNVRIARIKVDWTAPADQFVLSGGLILISYRKTGTSTWYQVKPVGGADTEAFIADVEDGQGYDVELVAQNAAGARSAAVTASITASLIGSTWGGKNPINNAAFLINAANVNLAPSSAAWLVETNIAIANVTTAQAAESPAAVPSGFSLAATPTAANTRFGIESPLVPLNFIKSGQPYIAHMWARVSSGTATAEIAVRRGTGEYYGTGKTVTLTTSWQEFVVLFTATDTNDGTIVGGTVRNASVWLECAAGLTSGVTLYATGAMLEIGTIVHPFDGSLVGRGDLLGDFFLGSNPENLSRDFQFANAGFWAVSGGASIDTANKRGRVLYDNLGAGIGAIQQWLTTSGLIGGTSRFVAGDDVTVVLYPFYGAGAVPTQKLTVAVFEAGGLVVQSVDVQPSQATPGLSDTPIVIYIPKLTGSANWYMQVQTTEITNPWYVTGFCYYRGRGAGKPLPSALDVGATTPSAGSSGTPNTGGAPGSGPSGGGGGIGKGGTGNPL